MKHGFIIIEIIVVFIILATLFGIGYVSVARTLRRAPLTATVETLLADLRAQQTLAMSGRERSGIEFYSNRYTLFTDGSGSSNIPLPDHITISGITFPSAQVAFEKGSGEIEGFTSGANTITVTEDITNMQKVISINRYGAVTQIQ